MRAFLTLPWLGRHALLLVTLVALGRIGWWQYDSGRTQGDWQNYGYAVQWWLFGAFAVFLWVKAVLDELDPARLEAPPEPPELPAVVQRQAPAPAEDEDDELAEYNRRLAELAREGERR